MGLIKEFKEFAMRGNVIDMAVGIIIGAAFGPIVSTLVDKIIMPPIGMLLGNVDFSDLKLVLQKAEGEQAEIAMYYGEFINVVINFIIVAFAVFMLIKVMNSLKKKEEEKPAAPPAPSKEELLLAEIRDAIKARGV